ncbi:alpha-glucosidase-like [Bombus vosnesenskii]|uniref:alpha-glucosidase n=1 Tax=Bombus vosnesenskii TaxID=207650 RepID=A0A6J3KIV4_9HYME|nr:alpha-glucosidase-like [Bombus vosnesenskii]
MFRLTITSCFLLFALSAAVDVNWFKNAIVYQIYPRSFKDSNGDGIGDLNGITSKLEHIKDIGATALWLSPIYKSPQVDFGYDISNYTDIEPTYGTLADFDKLVAKAKSLGLKVILDFVPNHSSPEHPWFKKSVQKIKPYDEYYVWRDAKIVNGTRKPPNNWLSGFGGSAWEWNNVRKQYYLHQFAIGQPDLNYRNKDLNQEIKNVFTFWMDRGVDGFRIDAINLMFEDANFRDEPSANRTDIPSDDYDSLLHIYTLDQNETYGTLNSWRKLMDDHSNRTNSDPRLILTEAYTTHERTMKYYTAGSNVPFNFMFITSLNNKSTAMDYKNLIDKWVKSVPSGNVPNWVVGNHDNHRVASRFGTGRANMIIQMAMVLPGIAVIYNGDEIGMVDRPFTYKETLDPAGCNAGPARYYLKSRDPERTPFQWDSTTSAGFSNSTKTWLPVHSNYKTLNLAAQKRATSSPYQLFKKLMNIKKRPVIARGSLNVSILDKQVLGITRTLGSETVIVMLNFGNEPVKVNARASLSVPPALVVYAADVDSYPRPGTMVFTNSITIPASSSVMYTSPNIYRSMNE